MEIKFQATHQIEWAPLVRSQTSSYIPPQYVKVMRLDQEVSGYYFAYTQEEWENRDSLSCPTWRYNIQIGSWIHRDYSEIGIGQVVELRA
jgi:hypothetical protein